MMRHQLPAWIRRVEKGLSPPGWVQLEALKSLSSHATELDAARLVSEDFMYVFTDSNGNPALTRCVTLGDGGWDYEGVVVPAIQAHTKGLITKRELEVASRRWT